MSVRAKMEALLEGGTGATPWKSAEKAYMDGVKFGKQHGHKSREEAEKARKKIEGYVGKKVAKLTHGAPAQADRRVADIIDDLYHLWYYAGMLDGSRGS
jgi:hypothetical protein